jgi:hypothetical protein
LDEENIQLQIQLNQACKQLEEHEQEVAARVMKADEDDTRAALSENRVHRHAPETASLSYPSARTLATASVNAGNTSKASPTMP